MSSIESLSKVNEQYNDQIQKKTSELENLVMQYKDKEDDLKKYFSFHKIK
jgi:hypothetical protein